MRVNPNSPKLTTELVPDGVNPCAACVCVERKGGGGRCVRIRLEGFTVPLTQAEDRPYQPAPSSLCVSLSLSLSLHLFLCFHHICMRVLTWTHTLPTAPSLIPRLELKCVHVLQLLCVNKLLKSMMGCSNYTGHLQKGKNRCNAVRLVLFYWSEWMLTASLTRLTNISPNQQAPASPISPLYRLSGLVEGCFVLVCVCVCACSCTCNCATCHS